MKTRIIALLSLLTLSSVCYAGPIRYEAEYEITRLVGAPPAEWGDLSLGSTAVLQFIWDWSHAVPIYLDGAEWDPGPMAYEWPQR